MSTHGDFGGKRVVIQRSRLRLNSVDGSITARSEYGEIYRGPPVSTRETVRKPSDEAILLLETLVSY